MAKKVIKTDLSVKGLERLKKELLEYKRDYLQDRVKTLVERLAESGVSIAKANVNESPLGKYVTIQANITEEQAGCKAIIVATGEVKESEGYAPFNTLLAIEFGAGIHHNSTANPNADKFGLGVGTFPGQIHAFDDGWWYWDDKLQEWRYTHGVKATMPMYNASMEMQNKIVAIAKEVFK